LEVRLAGCNGVAQLEIFLDEARDSKLFGVSDRLLDFTQEDVRSILSRFPAVDDWDAVQTWLTLLVKFADSRAINGWDRLPGLLCHSDPKIVELAIALASRD